MKFIVIVAVCLLCSFGVRSDYTAAVVEFFPEQDSRLSPEERLSKNVNGYIGVLDQLSQTSKIDIVVYPEMALSANALVKKHSDLLPYSVEIAVNGTSLCNPSVSNFIAPLACAAVKYKTYMVVNLYEKTPCKETKCHWDGWSLYNTNVVFDRNGIIISRYRKYNLFGEAHMARPKEPDFAIFRTDFNETFATFVCFDILFKQPALDLVQKHGAKSFVYPTMWFSQLPFLTALQVQQQWAYATNATLLASCANDRGRGSGGTGIYQGTKGPLVYAMAERGGFVAKVSGTVRGSTDTSTIDKKAREMDGFRLKSDRLERYSSKLLPNRNSVLDTVCSRDGETEFCCNFELELEWGPESNNAQYQYHMVAYSGPRFFVGVTNGGVEVCAIVACTNESLSSCGKRFLDYNAVSWPANFKKIVIKAEFDVDDNKFQFPNSLLSNIEPIAADAFEWTSTADDKRVNRTYTLKKPQNRLMTFGIYGRVFNRNK